MGERGNISKKTGHIIRLLVCNNRKRADKLIDVIKLYAEKIRSLILAARFIVGPYYIHLSVTYQYHIP